MLVDGSRIYMSEAAGRSPGLVAIGRLAEGLRINLVRFSVAGTVRTDLPLLHEDFLPAAHSGCRDCGDWRCDVAGCPESVRLPEVKEDAC